MWKFTYTQSERKQVQAHEVRLKRKGESGKPRVSESKGIVYFYFAEQKQFQAHKVRLKVKAASERKQVQAHEVWLKVKVKATVWWLFYYLYSRNIHGILDKSGTLPRHSLTVRVLAYSPSQVRFAAMQSFVCGRQVARISSTILPLR